MTFNNTLVVLSYLTICGFCQCTNTERLLVDRVTLDYLSVENDLWARLTNSVNDDKEHLFALVRNSHKRFLNDSVSFGGTECAKKNVYDLQPKKEFAETLKKWNYCGRL